MEQKVRKGWSSDDGTENKTEIEPKPYCMARIDYTYEDGENDRRICVPHIQTWHNHLTDIQARRFHPDVVAGQTRAILFLHGSELCLNGPTEGNFPVEIRFEGPSAFYTGKFGEGGWGYDKDLTEGY